MKHKKKLKLKKLKIDYLFYIIGVIISLVMLKTLTKLILLAFFSVITFILVRISIKVEHVTFDSYSSTTMFLAFTYGPLIGIIYAILVGLISFSASRLNQYTISNIVLAVLTCGIILFFKGSFFTTFLYTSLIRAVIGFFWFMMLGSDILENLTQASSLLLMNILIYLPLLNLINTVINLI